MKPGNDKREMVFRGVNVIKHNFLWFSMSVSHLDVTLPSSIGSVNVDPCSIYVSRCLPREMSLVAFSLRKEVKIRKRNTFSLVLG